MSEETKKSRTEYFRQYREKNREKYNAYHREYRCKRRPAKSVFLKKHCDYLNYLLSIGYEITFSAEDIIVKYKSDEGIKEISMDLDGFEKMAEKMAKILKLTLEDLRW